MNVGVDPVILKVPDADGRMCWEILEEAYRSAGYMEDEPHFHPQKVMAAAKRLKDAGVTCTDVSRMTGAVCLIDKVSSATFRPLDRHIEAKQGYLRGSEQYIPCGHPPVLQQERGIAA